MITTEGVISIVSLLISALAVIVSFKTDEKVNKANIFSDYIKEIYKEYLLYKIPNARKQMCFSRGYLKTYENMTDVLDNLRKDSMYFYYQDNDYYEQLKRRIFAAEDIIVNQTGRRIHNEEQMIFKNRLEEAIRDIYIYIGEKHLKG